MSDPAPLVPQTHVERLILILRGRRVLLDSDLAELYGVETKVLLRAVRRNEIRFPEDFAFQLTEDEWVNLRRQIVTSSKIGGPGGRRYVPTAFTEQGVAMLSSVLRSARAVQVNIEIMRAFVRLRQVLASHAELAGKLEAMDRKYDVQFKVVFDAIRELMEPPPEPPKGRIGFRRP